MEQVFHKLLQAGDMIGGQLVVLDLESGQTFAAVAVLRLVDSGRISLGAVVGGGASAAITLEQVLAHTSGIIEMIPASVKAFRDLCDSEGMARSAATMAPLLPPGARQQYHHTTYGWLLARACQVAGTSMQEAWAE